MSINKTSRQTAAGGFAYTDRAEDELDRMRITGQQNSWKYKTLMEPRTPLLNVVVAGRAFVPGAT